MKDENIMMDRKRALETQKIGLDSSSTHGGFDGPKKPRKPLERQQSEALSSSKQTDDAHGATTEYESSTVEDSGSTTAKRASISKERGRVSNLLSTSEVPVDHRLYGVGETQREVPSTDREPPLSEEIDIPTKKSLQAGHNALKEVSLEPSKAGNVEQLEKAARDLSKIDRHHPENTDMLSLAGSDVSTAGSDDISAPKTPVGEEESKLNAKMQSELSGAPKSAAEIHKWLDGLVGNGLTEKLNRIVPSAREGESILAFPMLGYEERPAMPDNLRFPAAVEILTNYPAVGREKVEGWIKRITDAFPPRVGSEDDFILSPTTTLDLIKIHINRIADIGELTAARYRVIDKLLKDLRDMADPNQYQDYSDVLKRLLKGFLSEIGIES